LKKGYKRTEAGVIPKEWDTVPLGQISDVVMGQSPSGATYNKNGIGIPLINGPTEFTDKNPIKVQWTTEPTKLCKINDILLCVRGSSTGRMNIADSEYCIGRGVAAIRANSKSVTTYLTFQMHLAIEKLLSLSAGSTFPNVDGKSIRSIQIPLPPLLGEQRAIATALSDVDTLIAALDKLIAKKRAIKTATMQQLLTGKKRLPGFSGDWENIKLADICNCIMDGTHFTPTYVDSGIPFYSVETITNDSFSDTKYISEKEHELLIKRCKPEKGDILITRIGTLGQTKLIDWEVNASIYVSLALLKLRSNVCHEYVYGYTKSDQFVQDIEKRSLLHATPKKINLDQISSVPIMMPEDREEQIAISEVLKDMDAEITALEARCNKTQAIKQGMMQELLTGRTRLI